MGKYSKHSNSGNGKVFLSMLSLAISDDRKYSSPCHPLYHFEVRFIVLF